MTTTIKARVELRAHGNLLFSVEKQLGEGDTVILDISQAVDKHHQLIASAQRALTDCCDLIGTPAGEALQAAIDKATALPTTAR